MTVKCAVGGCQITENKIESHQGEHTIYLSHSKRGILFLPTMEARHSWRLLVHKHAIRGNQPALGEANHSVDIHFLLKTYSKSENSISYWPTTFKTDEPKHTICCKSFTNIWTSNTIYLNLASFAERFLELMENQQNNYVCTF